MFPVAFELLFLIGAVGIRTLSLPGLVFIHAGWMLFPSWVFIAAIELGIWMAVVTQQIDTAHAIIGLAVLVSLFVQPVSGPIHRLLYKRQSGPNVATLPHVFWGRATVTLGIINGGLGLQLGGNIKKDEIEYGVLAALISLLWLGVILFSFLKIRSTKGENIDGGEELVGIRSKPCRMKPVNQHDPPIASSFSKR